eukprot:SAG25_NODE_14193_length_258_cov_0.584906_1_plen_33_part_10
MAPAFTQEEDNALLAAIPSDSLGLYFSFRLFRA